MLTYRKRIIFFAIVLVALWLIIDAPAARAADRAQEGMDPIACPVVESPQQPTRTRVHVAAFLIDFPDTPSEMRARFPTKQAMADTLFRGRIKEYFDAITYGQLTLSGDIFGYFRHQSNGVATDGSAAELNVIKTIDSITVPNFDASQYDYFVLLSVADSRLAGGRAGAGPLLVNGVSYNNPLLFVPLQIGYWDRNPFYGISNTLVDKKAYSIWRGDNDVEEGVVSMAFSPPNQVNISPSPSLRVAPLAVAITPLRCRCRQRAILWLSRTRTLSVAAP